MKPKGKTNIHSRSKIKPATAKSEDNRGEFQT